MNYKSINTRQKKPDVVHALGEHIALINTTGDIAELNGNKLTLCGFKIENGIYKKWEQTEEEVSCKRCLNGLRV